MRVLSDVFSLNHACECVRMRDERRYLNVSFYDVVHVQPVVSKPPVAMGDSTEPHVGDRGAVGAEWVYATRCSYPILLAPATPPSPQKILTFLFSEWHWLKCYWTPIIESQGSHISYFIKASGGYKQLLWSKPKAELLKYSSLTSDFPL